MKDKVRQFIVVISFLITVTINALANILPLNGQLTGEISDSFNVVFVPAGYVFSIWGLIYLSLAGFTIYQALPTQRENPSLRSIGFLFALSNIANAAWIFLWHYNFFPLTLLVMVTLLGLLLAIYLILGIGKKKFSAVEKWLVAAPFSIYLGWITVATIANATAVLKNVGWNGFGITGQIWTIILLAVALVISVMMSFSRKDIAYNLVLVWAFIGIGMKWMGVYPDVVITSFVTAGLVLVFLAIARFRKKSLPG